jgi:hypothetical protein
MLHTWARSHHITCACTAAPVAVQAFSLFTWSAHLECTCDAQHLDQYISATGVKPMHFWTHSAFLRRVALLPAAAVVVSRPQMCMLNLAKRQHLQCRIILNRRCRHCPEWLDASMLMAKGAITSPPSMLERHKFKLCIMYVHRHTAFTGTCNWSFLGSCLRTQLLESQRRGQ